MSRRTLIDGHWGRIEGHLPGRAGTRGRSGVDNRLFVDAILWMGNKGKREFIQVRPRRIAHRALVRIRDRSAI